MNLLFKEYKPLVQEIKNNALYNNGSKLFIARLDLIHPVVSGNKLFKLHYFLKEAIQSSHKKLITFGGAYSNHLVATAFAAREAGMLSLGIVRGEKNTQLSPSLRFCEEQGMELQYLDRNDYRKINQQDYIKELANQHPGATIIPEGGFAPDGAKGASLIMDLLQQYNSTHICSATGTATTIAGLLLKAQANTKIISFPALKGMNDITKRILFLTGKSYNGQLQIENNYHFGGYAKSNAALFSFMNDFYLEHHVPLDFVYTGKMMFGVMDKVSNNEFQENSTIICLHTGGLQGNNSLPQGTLVY